VLFVYSPRYSIKLNILGKPIAAKFDLYGNYTENPCLDERGLEPTVSISPPVKLALHRSAFDGLVEGARSLRKRLPRATGDLRSWHTDAKPVELSRRIPIGMPAASLHPHGGSQSKKVSEIDLRPMI